VASLRENPILAKNQGEEFIRFWVLSRNPMPLLVRHTSINKHNIAAFYQIFLNSLVLSKQEL
jgi:hypothetical protein